MAADTKSFTPRINPQTLLFFLHNFFINVGTTLVYVSANILLLENHPEYSLPLAYIAAAFAVMAAGKIYEYFEHHLILEKLSLGTMLATLFMVLVVMVLLWLGHGVGTAIAIMVGYRIIYLLINLEFWGLSALVFDVRQSKRLFSVIGSGDMPAKALGAVLAVIIHSPSVLMILLAISLGFFALAYYTQKRTFRYTDIPNPHHAHTRAQASVSSAIVRKYFGGNGLVTALCLGMVFVAAAATWIEYHFFVNVKYKFHSQHDVIIFVGSLLTATYVISAFVKLMFSGKTVERFGVRITLYLLPLTTILISLGLIVSSYFRKDEPSLLVYYCMAYLLFELIRRTIFDPVFLVLFQPLSTKNRLKGHTLAKGLYEPMGMLLAGVILWVVYTMKWSDISLTFDLSLLFALAAMFIFRKAYRQYVLELKSAISKRFLRSGEMASPAEALPIIIANLQSDKKEEVINAVDWLAANKPSALKSNIDALLKNPNVTVRRKTLETLYRENDLPVPVHFGTYVEHEPDATCQTLALRLACANKMLSHEKIAYYLAHPDPDIVRGAIIGCWESNTSLPLVHGTLQKLFGSEDEMLQLTALECLQIIGIGGYAANVRDALQHESARVRREAITLAAASDSPLLHREIKRFLTGSLAKPAVFALVKAGDFAGAVLEEWLQEPGKTSEGALHLARALELNPRHSLVHLLIKLLKSTYQDDSSTYILHINLAIRRTSLKALTTNTYLPEFTDDLQPLLHAELLNAAILFGMLGADDVREQLRKALSAEAEAATERIYFLLAILHDREAVQNAWKGMAHASREKRANSIEMMESVLPRPLTPALRALFEDLQPAERYALLIQYLGETAPQPLSANAYILSVRERFFSSWTIAIAVDQLSPQNDAAQLTFFASHPVRLIREVAKAKLSQTYLKTNHMEHADPNRQVSEMERIIVLKNTQLFAETPENVLSSIAPIMKEVTFAEGQQIFAKGDVGDSMYVIYTGEVGIYDGPKQLARFDKGEIFGELALMDSEPRSATTIAETDTLVFRIDQEDFFELMEERDEILRNVLRILCQRIRVQNDKMRELSLL